jgi:oligopeptide transport system substrate-binding protein
LERAANDADAAGREALLQQAETLMLVDQPLIPLYFYVSKHLVAESIHGWRNNVMNVVYSKDLAKLGAGGNR